MPGIWRKQTWQSNPTLDAPARYRRACHYETFIPNQLATLEAHLHPGIAGLVSDAEQAIHRLNAQASPALVPLARLLLRTESIASSKVEGMQIGVREMARAEALADTGITPAATAAELIDNIDAMELAVGRSAEAPRFTVAEIVAIHTRLMHHAPNAKIAGRIRTQQNWIGGNDYNPCGADFVPPPPEEIPRLLDDLCEAVNDEQLSPLVQAALVHAQFESIHPFDDGNGRTGRALIQVVLRRRGIAPSFVPPISVVLAASRKRYIDGLTAFRGDGIAVWIEQFAGAAARAARLAIAYVGAVAALQDKWRGRMAKSIGSVRADAAAWAMIDVLPAYPIITGPVAGAATGRVKTAIYTAINQLVDARVLIPLSTARRNRAWEADGLLELIGQLEAGEFP